MTASPRLALAALVAFAAAACGGSGASGPAQSPASGPAQSTAPAADAELTPMQICVNVEHVVRHDPNCTGMPHDVLTRCERRISSELETAAGDPDALAARHAMFQCMGRADTCGAIDACIDALVAPPLEP